MRLLKCLSLFLFLLFAISTAEARDGDVQVWVGDSNTETTPQPTPVQPTNLTPWYFPWDETGMTDSGYCSMVWGWGWDGSMIWPIENHHNIRSFGYFPGGVHAGLDIYAEIGTPIISPVNGTIIWNGGNSTGFGNQTTGMVAIASSGRVIILGHMSATVETLACGDSVYKGDLVGYVGCVGACTESHIHLEIRYENLAWDPMLWLP